MDVLLYILLIISFSCGLIILFLLISRSKDSSDPGTSLFLIPLVPLTMITIFETINYYLRTRFPSNQFLIIEIIDDFLLICVAFGWNYIALRHYELNRLSVFTDRKKNMIYTAVFILTAGLPLLYFFYYEWKNIIHILTIAWLFLAGSRAVIFHFKAVDPLPSSKTAVKIAFISLIINSVIFIGNILNWSLPVLDKNINFWVQTYPLYIIFINIPVLVFLVNSNNIPELIHTLPDGDSVNICFSNVLTDP